MTPRDDKVPSVLYVLSATILCLLSWLFISMAPLGGTIISLLLVLPAALLLHASGIFTSKKT